MNDEKILELKRSIGAMQSALFLWKEGFFDNEDLYEHLEEFIGQDDFQNIGITIALIDEILEKSKDELNTLEMKENDMLNYEKGNQDG